MVCVVILAALPAAASAAAPAPEPAGEAGLQVQAPPPGYGIAMTALTLDGREFDVVVETGPDGVTRVSDADAAVTASSASAAAVKSACTDRKYVLQKFRWTRPWEWRFNAGTTPTGMSRAAVETQLRSAVRSITNARNDCGIPDRVNAKARYLGRTSRKTSVRSDAGCAAWDGQNVVAFGNLPPYIAGVTCSLYTVRAQGRGQAIESDVLLNRRHHRWAIRPKSCSGNQVVLRAVATHEFGHVFGLGHVREDRHPHLTMSESIRPCDDSAFTLGRGDILGLEKLY